MAGRKLAVQLVDQQLNLPLGEVDQLSPKVQRARSDYIRALQQQARDHDEPLWPGGYDMFSRRQMAYIRKELRKLGRNDRRQDVYDAFLLLIGNIEQDTGEITLTRQEMADDLGILPRNLSTVMGTLERLGIVRREKQGRMVTYFVDANVAWNGDLTLRKAEAAKSTAPTLALVKGGRVKAEVT
jgi:DNA-binding transcriptional ArsR family regulator